MISNKIEAKYNKLLFDYNEHCKELDLITNVDENEDEAAQALRVKSLEKDYIKWFEYYFEHFAKSKCAWFHRAFAKLIIDNKRVNALAAWYRSAAKSVHIDLGIPLYLYFVKKDLFFMLLIGENDTKAKRLLSGIQAELEHNNRLKHDYDSRLQNGDWSNGDFLTTDGVRFMAIGFGVSPRGLREGVHRPDFIVCDDVDNRKHINNDRLMRESVEFIMEDVLGTFDEDENATQRFVFANNNFNRNGITNRLKRSFENVLERRKTEGLKEKGLSKFEVMTVNAVKNIDTFEPEWKEKTSAAYWRKKYADKDYRSFMREYMNTHIEEGKIFKFEDIQYCLPLPLNEYAALVFYGDLSYKEQGDFKAMILAGRKGKEFHVLLAYVRQRSRTNCAEWLYDVYEQYELEDYNIRYVIEGLFSMDEFINDFDSEGERRGYYIPVTANKDKKENKFDRIESMAGFFERRDVYFNTHLENNTDMQELINQLLAFEKGSNAHDDAPDALQGAFALLNSYTEPRAYTYAWVPRIDQKY